MCQKYWSAALSIPASPYSRREKEIYLLDSPKCSHQADRMLTTTAEEFEVKMPDVGEYSKEMKLAFEKEVLGIYISGHPLEEYRETWKKNITNTTADFALDEETGETRVADGAKVTIGGMITEKKINVHQEREGDGFFTGGGSGRFRGGHCFPEGL